MYEKKGRYIVEFPDIPTDRQHQTEISVEERRENKRMLYKILGLKAPQIALPASGHARWTREYEGLKGTYEFVVEGFDGTSTTFSVRFRSGAISLVKPPSGPHVQVIVTSSTRAEHKRT